MNVLKPFAVLLILATLIACDGGTGPRGIPGYAVLVYAMPTFNDWYTFRAYSGADGTLVFENSDYKRIPLLDIEVYHKQNDVYILSNDRVYIFDSAGNLVLEAGHVTYASAGFLLVDERDGSFWVISNKEGMEKYDRDGGYPIEYSDCYWEPRACDIYRVDGSIVLGRDWNEDGWVMKVDEFGDEVFYYDDLRDGFKDIAIDQTDGSFWVAYRDEIHKYNEEGELQLTVGLTIVPPDYLTGLAIDPNDGTCWVYSSAGIEQYDAGGRLNFSSESVYGYRGVVSGRDGALWLCDGLTGELFKVSKDGQRLMTVNDFNFNFDVGWCEEEIKE